MALIVSNVHAALTEGKDAVVERAARKAGLKAAQIERAYIVKESVDARRKDAVRLCYTVGFDLNIDEDRAASSRKDRDISVRRRGALSFEVGTRRLKSRPVVAGFGPAGMFAALALARNGYRPLVLERGAPVEERIQAVERFWKEGTLDENNNVQFGEGGAGTFSDGKLTTRIHDDRCGYILETFAQHGAPREILTRAKPHIGTDRLREVVRSIREEILSLGGEIRFHAALRDISVRNGRLCSIELDEGKLETEALVLAIGHSARDTFEMLGNREVPMEPKAFSVGVRIEHLQREIDTALYGKFASHPALRHGEYQLSLREGDRAVYTFCMCPGGLVVPSSSEAGGVVTNGMSEYARDRENANAALVVSVGASDFGSDVFAGMHFQRELEQKAFRAGNGTYRAPAQTVGNFLAGKKGLTLGRIQPSYSLGVEACDFGAFFPPFISQMLKKGLYRFDRRIKGYACDDAVLTGVETRTSSPIRILRGETLQSAGAEGLFPCGEGAGYAGGIVSAGVDGLRVAQALMRRYAPDTD
ncbi:NAD(P)/FAD-dependent oxidoreductase [Candidatus Soleaferrea massiliensis]|uniref:NAD(P)/FAD-dependent oxidoreductase n=1 Tax=Candidatus Soleaferrea massiliensis TaxID=1470354 RepID=UPI00058F176E|nr:hypothetical protein [Candidatus Soleaferrea massiliensis]